MSLAMSWNEWSALDATGLASLLRKGELTAVEAARQAAVAIGKTNPTLGAVVEVFDDVVEDPSRDGMDADGTFAGVPFLVKDLGPTMKGRLQEQGSLFLRGNRAVADTWFAQKMRHSGLNLIGRTTTPEFGTCGAAENPAVYVTRNPWNFEYSASGSSTGSAVAVAAGVVPMAHGTDGGGSIRTPAAFTGLLGLKPSRGTFSLAPQLSDITGLVSAQGCLARSVRDVAAFVDSCRGGAPGEFMPYRSPDQTCCEQIDADPKPLRIAISHRWGDFEAAPALVQELENAGTLFESLGHSVDWKVPDIDFRAAYDAQTFCYVSNFAQTINNMLTVRGLLQPPEDLFEPMNIRIWETGRDARYADRYRMQAVFNQTSRALGSFFDDWDVIVTPVSALPAPLLNATDYKTTSDNPDVFDWFASVWRYVPYTPLANLTGTPALTLPIARQHGGLPFGIHAQAAIGNDGLLLQLAAQVERAIQGLWNGGRLPPCHVSSIDAAVCR